jgi:hypothetical protein
MIDGKVARRGLLVECRLALDRSFASYLRARAGAGDGKYRRVLPGQAIVPFSQWTFATLAF